MTICRRWTMTTCGAAARRRIAPLTKRPRFSPATRCRRWRSRFWPTPRPIRSPRRASRSVWGWRGPSALRAWWAGRCSMSAAERRTAPLSVEEIALLQAMKTGALLKFSVEAGTRLAGAGATARTALETLRRSDRRRVPDRRRHSRRRKRRGDAGKARRQGRRAEQGDAGRRARARRRAPRTQAPRRRGDLGRRCGGRGGQWRHVARHRALRRDAEEE